MTAVRFSSSWVWIAAADVGLLVPYAAMMGGHLVDGSSGAAAGALALGAAIVFCWRRRGRIHLDDPPESSPAALATLAVAVPCYALAVFLDIRVGIGWCAALLLGAQVRLLAGRRALSALALPLVLLALSAPFPGFARSLLTQELVGLILVLAPPLLEVLIGPTSVEGHYLLVPGGELAIVDDCGGLSSLLLTVPLVVILAVAQRATTPLRVAALAVSALVLVFLGNFSRVIISAFLVAGSSPLAHSDTVHELIGTACVVVAFVAMFWVSKLLRGTQ